jgi:trimeric autotransporter adhesin
MRTTRFYLLLGMLALVAFVITGCSLGRMQNEPKAIFSASQVQQVIPFTASFDGTLSYDSDGQIVSYMWDFGDGGAGTGPQVTHDYHQNGTYAVSLTVIDDHGVSDASTLTVRALDPPPNATFSYSPKSKLDDNYIVGASEWITFDGSESTDNESIVAYNWNFGDGENDTGQVVKHRFLWPGTYNVALTVTDNDGGTTTYVNPVEVLGGPPCNADLTGGGPNWGTDGEQ